MRLHHGFEWDPRKAGQNERKHGVSLKLAKEVLADPEGDVYHLEEHADAHSREEDRYTTFGSHPQNRRILLRITWTIRRAGERRVTRIISARLVDKEERHRYEKEIGGQ
jgi:uncharacterized DUF497 family protein